MHILILPSFFPSEKKPTLGVFFYEQALALKKSGHKVGVLVVKTNPVPVISHLRTLALRPQLKKQTKCGLAMYSVIGSHWYLRRIPIVFRYYINRLGLNLFNEYCRNLGSPDIIHAHNTLYGGSLATYLKKNNRDIPVILTEHDSAFVRNRVSPQKVSIVRQTFSQVDHLIAVSPFLAEALKNYTERAIQVIGNIVDTEFFTPMQVNLSDKSFIFVAIASLDRNKGIDCLIEAFALAFRATPVQLIIAGDGPMRASLEKQAINLGVKNQVNFHGVLDRTGVRDLLQYCHVLVSSSYVETFGLTLIEAMACGKPVVATRSGGPEFIVTNENGILVEPGAVDVLAEAMEYMRINYSRYNSEAIRAGCIERFSKEAVTQQLTTVYESVNRK